MQELEHPSVAAPFEAQWSLGGEPLQSSRSAPGMRYSATGLGLIFCGVVMMMVLFAIAMAASVAGGIAIAANPGSQQTFGIAVAAISRIVSVGGLIGCLTACVGHFFCLAVPRESKARGLAVGIVALQVIGFMMIPVAIVVAVIRGGIDADMLLTVFQAAAVLLGFGTLWLFTLFLRAVSKYIGRVDLVGRAENVRNLLAAIAGLGAFAVILTVAKPEVWGLFAFLALVVTAITMLRYVNVTRSLRKAILAR